MSFVQHLYKRDLKGAIEAAAGIAYQLNLSPEELVARQASERAYALFRFSYEERQEKLRSAGNLLFPQQANLPFEDFEEDCEKMRKCVFLLRASLKLQPEFARDLQILSRAVSYRVLLCRSSINLFHPTIKLTSAAKAAQLSLILQQRIVPLGPKGPLEFPSERFDLEIFRRELEAKDKAVRDYWNLLTRLILDSKDEALRGKAKESFGQDIDAESNVDKLLIWLK